MPAAACRVMVPELATERASGRRRDPDRVGDRGCSRRVVREVNRNGGER